MENAQAGKRVMNCVGAQPSSVARDDGFPPEAESGRHLELTCSNGPLLSLGQSTLKWCVLLWTSCYQRELPTLVERPVSWEIMWNLDLAGANVPSKRLDHGRRSREGWEQNHSFRIKVTRPWACSAVIRTEFWLCPHNRVWLTVGGLHAMRLALLRVPENQS